MVDLYYSATPYHALLSACVSRQINTDRQSILIISPDFENNNIFLRALKSSGGNVFDEIKNIGEIHSKTGFSRRFERSVQVKRTLDIIMGEHIDRVFVCHDGHSVGQTLLKKAGDDCQCTYIEDGMVAYNSEQAGPDSFWKLMAGKIFYGWWWEPNKIPGTDQKIDNIAAIFPNHLRPSLQSVPSNKIEKNFICQFGPDIFRSFLNFAGQSCNQYREIDTVILPKNSKEMNETQIYNIKSIIQNKLRSGSKIGIKYHPRESKNDFLVTPEHDSVKLIPTSIPAELVFTSVNNVKKVVGYPSTALLTGKWLLSEAEVICLSGDHSNSDRLLDTFRKIGVQIKIVDSKDIGRKSPDF